MTLAVGIVGCGNVARHHVPALRAAHGAELIAAFDLDTAAARATGAAVAGSLDELIEHVDLVAVCTPPETARDGRSRPERMASQRSRSSSSEESDRRSVGRTSKASASMSGW